MSWDITCFLHAHFSVSVNSPVLDPNDSLNDSMFANVSEKAIDDEEEYQFVMKKYNSDSGSDSDSDSSSSDDESGNENSDSSDDKSDELDSNKSNVNSKLNAGNRFSRVDGPRIPKR